MKGALGTRPVIMLHGRADGLIPVNHSSRAYYAVNQAQEGPSGLRYYELIHGQHFDGLLGLSEFACRYVPLQPWIGRSLDRVYDRLRGGPALPPSQVLRTLPREQSAAGLADLHNDHLGQWRDAPDDDTIEFKDHTLHVPL